jgi:EmrB/QacA subfamily drug resistance transporter
MWNRAPRSTIGSVSHPANRGVILVLCCLGQFLGVLDVSIVNVGLAPIRADLGFSSAGLQWVVGAYTLACSGFLLLGGRAADLFGRREVFAGGLLLFALASLAGGLAQGQATLIAARAGQGLGGAVIAPTSLSILATVYDEGAERNRALGLWGTMGALGGASGAVVGGLLVDVLSWRWLLLVTAPVAFGVALAALRTIPALGRRRDAARSFDLRGAIAVTGGLVLVTCGIAGSNRDGWGAATTAGPIAAGVALLLLFWVIETRLAAAPLVPPRIFRSRALAGATGVVFCLGATAVSMWFFLSLYMQRVLGYSALHAGLTFLPMSLTIAACTRAASLLAGRLGPGRVLAAGMTLLGAGMLLLARSAGTAGVLLPALLCAAGIGCSFVSTNIAAALGVAREDSGLASGVVNTAFQIGGSIGLAVLATVAAGRTAAADGAVPEALTEGYRLAFALGGGFALAGAALALGVIAGEPGPRRAPATTRGSSRACPDGSSRRSCTCRGA